MATDFGELTDHFDPDLNLSIRGKRYRIAAPSIPEARELRAALEGELTEAQELDAIDRLLGETAAEMVADGVRWPEYRHVGRTALFFFGVSEDLAQMHWLRPDPGWIAQLTAGLEQAAAAAPAPAAAPQKAPAKRTSRKATAARKRAATPRKGRA